MKNKILTILALVSVALPVCVHAQLGSILAGSTTSSVVNQKVYIGTSGQCLEAISSSTLGGSNFPAWATCGSGGGSGSSTFSTSTAYSGVLNNYSNNKTDVVEVGGTSTSTALFYFDPNLPTWYASGTPQSNLMYRNLGNGLRLDLPLTEKGPLFYDTTPYKNNGIGDGSVVTGTSSPAGVGVSIYGQNSGIDIPYNGSLSGLNAMSMGAWVYATSSFAGASEEVISRHGSGNYGESLLGFVSASDLRFFVITAGPNRVNLDGNVPNGNFADGQWHLVMGTYDGATERVYYDGKFLASLPQTGQIQTEPLLQTCIGNFDGALSGSSGACTSASFGFNGNIAQPLIWNRALSAQEVAALYTAGSVGAVFSGNITGDTFTAASTTATSTFAAGIQTTALNVTSTIATSTFANGITLSKGCFAIQNTCVPTSGGGGSGTVNSGTASDIAYYAASTNAVSASSTITLVTSNTIGEFDLNGSMKFYQGNTLGPLSVPTIRENASGSGLIINGPSNGNLFFNTDNTTVNFEDASAFTTIGSAGSTNNTLSVVGNESIGYQNNTFVAPTNGLLVSGFEGIATTSPWAALSVEGTSTLGNNAIAGILTATSSSRASTFPYASTTAITISGTNGLQIATGVNGPLQANAGLVSATTSVGVLYGGTGLTSIASSSLLLGNISGGYTAYATSSLGLSSGGSGTVNSGTTGQNAFYAANGTTVSATSTLFESPQSYVGISSTSPFAHLSVSGYSGDTNPLFALSTSTSGFSTSTAVIVDSNGNLNLVNMASLIVGSSSAVYLGTTTPKSSAFITGQCNPSQINFESYYSANGAGSAETNFACNGNASFGGAINAPIVNGARFSFVGSGSPGSVAGVLGGGVNQSVDIFDIRNNFGTNLDVFNNLGYEGIGTSTPSAILTVTATSSNQTLPVFMVAGFPSAGVATTTLFRISNVGQITSSTTVPVITACGTGPTFYGDDQHMTVTVGSVSATGCTATFGTQFPKKPTCNVTNQSPSLTSALGYTESASAVVVTQATGLIGDVLDINCAITGNGG